jgi:MFS family permease
MSIKIRKNTTEDRRTMNPEKKAMGFVILLGFVSLLADITYEGARSIQGQYLAVLGASGAAVGIIAGFGEGIGYGFRLLSGYASDKTGNHWFFTYLGYTMNLIAIPLLACATSWPMAAVLLILERFGKSIRTPPRDAMLSYATDQIGRGTGFGIHEAMDRTGAVLGPLIISFILLHHSGYHLAFAILAIPAALSLFVLTRAQRFSPEPKEFAIPQLTPSVKGFPSKFWLTVLALSLVGAGTVDFSLMGFHLQKSPSFSATTIPLLFASAMIVNSLSALFVGRMYDLLGVPTLLAALGIGALATPLVFLGDTIMAFIGSLLWGISLATQRAVGNALIAELAPIEKRSSAYGIFYIIFGLFWFLGSAIMGIFYDISLTAMVAFSVIIQIIALPILAQLRSENP